MPDHTQLKQHDNNAASWMCNYMQQINKIAQLFLEIFAICYFGEHWACPSMPEQTQQALHDLTKASMDI